MTGRRERYLEIVAEVHADWSRRNQPDRFAPGEHPAHSDYNVETLEIEATGEQLDDFDAELRRRLDAAGLHEYPLRS